MKKHIIRAAENSDLSSITKIAESLVLDSDRSQGFLVSNYKIDTYQYYFGHTGINEDQVEKVIFLVAECYETHAVKGFLIAYHSSFIEGNSHFANDSTERRIFNRFGDAREFYVIKQVGVSRDSVGSGLGTKIYTSFFSHLSAVTRNNGEVDYHPAAFDVFAAVMREPDNEKSSNFHRKFGFAPVIAYGDKLGEGNYQREVLHTTAQGALQYIKDRSGDKSIENIAEVSLQHANDLYLHEDNLNWTKLNYLTQYFAMLFIAQFIFPSLASDMNSNFKTPLLLGGHVFITGMMVYLVFSFVKKLESGSIFMARYKRSVLIAESKMKLAYPNFTPSVLSVPRLSKTVKMLNTVKILFWSAAILSSVFNTFIIISID